MTYKIVNSKHSGTFTIAPGKEFSGELILAGEDSCLDVWSSNVHDFLRLQISRIITGVLHESKKAVSLICCLQFNLWPKKEDKYYIRIIADLILIGDHHFCPNKDTICEVSLVIDDETALFPDVSTDEKGEIFVANTKLGKISASRTKLLDPLGILDDVERDIISINLRPVKTRFKEVMKRTLFKVQGIIGLLIGRPQNIVELTITTGPTQVPLQVYVHRLPEYKRFKNTELCPNSLINATKQQKELTRILENWFERDNTWYEVRGRFFNNVGPANIYSGDRLIIIANLFDILPDIVSDVELSEDLKSARDQCKNIFKNLKEITDERASVLSALARVGKCTLKRKIQQRGQLLICQIGDKIPDIDMVIKEAVKCRNHYVHGSDSHIDYNQNKGTEVFLTATLEFIFAASDLFESGWDIRNWCQNHYNLSSSHHFSTYLYNYNKNLNELKSLL